MLKLKEKKRKLMKKSWKEVANCLKKKMNKRQTKNK